MLTPFDTEYLRTDAVQWVTVIKADRSVRNVTTVTLEDTGGVQDVLQLSLNPESGELLIRRQLRRGRAALASTALGEVDDVFYRPQLPPD